MNAQSPPAPQAGPPPIGAREAPAASSPRLGVLGGMGPLATVDFLARLVAATPAVHDHDHIPVVVWSVPQVPDRLAALAGRGESPLPMMVEGLRALARCGAVQAVIACNTAHHWYDALVEQGGLPILHIADAASEAISRRADAASEAISRRADAPPPGSPSADARSRPPAPIALFATRGTHSAGFYAPRLAVHGHRALPMDERLQRECIDSAIEAVKAHRLEAAASHMAEALNRVAAEGIDTVLLACTELPLAYAAIRLAPQLTVIDGTAALAEAAVRRWFETHPRPRASDRVADPSFPSDQAVPSVQAVPPAPGDR